MKPIFREYKDSDYGECEELVNSAWGFDKIFHPRQLADLAKCIYTKGSVLGSNHRRVVEIDGGVVGFIFGHNENRSKIKRNIIFELSILWRLIRIKSSEKGGKKNLMTAINNHEINRSKLVERGRSEVVLFVVSSQYQGLGYGKRLISDFVADCRSSGVESIIVETNKLGASSFYERVGFKHMANFESPLHEYATQGGQACMYEFICK